MSYLNKVELSRPVQVLAVCLGLPQGNHSSQWVLSPPGLILREELVKPPFSSLSGLGFELPCFPELSSDLVRTERT